MSRERLYLFDTTLRDGAQTNGVDFTLADKLAIIAMLDKLGIDYVEGGYPGANPTDTALFSEMRLLNTTFTAFGMTRRPGRSASNDPGLNALLDAKDEVARTVSAETVTSATRRTARFPTGRTCPRRRPLRLSSLELRVPAARAVTGPTGSTLNRGVPTKRRYSAVLPETVSTSIAMKPAAPTRIAAQPASQTLALATPAAANTASAIGGVMADRIAK